jgi:hypothetical protein
MEIVPAAPICNTSPDTSDYCYIQYRRHISESLSLVKLFSPYKLATANYEAILSELVILRLKFVKKTKLF